MIPYITGGITANWIDFARALVDAGADALEVGIPFSDPVMDGPTIQQGSAQALERGTTPTSILAELRSTDLGVPVVVMTYYNLVFRAGEVRFADALSGAGISGAIVPDLCLEESRLWEEAANESGVASVLLVAPVTPNERMRKICARSRGFVYAVGLMGVTGARAELAASATDVAVRAKAVTDKPVIVGFGISTPGQANQAAEVGDGVIVASAIVSRILEGQSPTDVGTFVAGFRTALDHTGKVAK